MDTEDGLQLTDGRGSLARVTASPDHRVTQYGPRRLWDTAEHALRLWHLSARPTADRLGLTVHADGTHVLWLDEPGNVVVAAPHAGPNSLSGTS